MQIDFHYYAAYCAAILAGYSHEESLVIAYSDQFVDCCSKTLLKKLRAPRSAATTQLQPELMNERSDVIGIQNITRIWASFHFLPYDLYAKFPKWRPRIYMNKYRLICRPNGALVADTVNLAKDKGLQAAGIAMHVLSDTWAHSYFCGTPANVINNTNSYFYEIREIDGVESEIKIEFRHSPSTPDDVENGIYSSSLHQERENSIMNLGHGRAGHFPDYGFAKYKYLPAWGEYEIIVKNNPEDYYHAFTQMVYALRYLRGEEESFELGHYDETLTAPWEQEIRSIIEKRRPVASDGWAAFGEKLSGQAIEPFDIEKYQQEYLSAGEEEKDSTCLGRFFIAAMAQKSMVTHKIFESGNLLAGFSVKYSISGFKGMKDFKKLVAAFVREKKK